VSLKIVVLICYPLKVKPKVVKSLIENLTVGENLTRLRIV